MHAMKQLTLLLAAAVLLASCKIELPTELSPKPESSTENTPILVTPEATMPEKIGICLDASSFGDSLDHYLDDLKSMQWPIMLQTLKDLVRGVENRPAHMKIPVELERLFREGTVASEKFIYLRNEINVTSLKGNVYLSRGNVDISFSNDNVIIAEGNVNIAHAANSIIIAGGTVNISHVTDCVIITGEDLDISHSRGSILLANGKIEVSHEGNPTTGLLSRGSLLVMTAIGVFTLGNNVITTTVAFNGGKPRHQIEH